jgi:hypothetical protein
MARLVEHLFVGITIIIDIGITIVSFDSKLAMQFISDWSKCATLIELIDANRKLDAQKSEIMNIIQEKLFIDSMRKKSMNVRIFMEEISTVLILN